MTFVILIFVALLAIGAPDRSSFHPVTAALLTSQNVESIDCEPMSGPESVLDAPRPSRTSNFHLLGEYKCARPVFSADERNPFIERVLKAQTDSAKQVSLIVGKAMSPASQLETKNGSAPPVVVRVEGPIAPDLRDRVETIYRHELMQALGAGRVSHDRNPSAQSPLLEIQLHLVDDPALMASARLSVPERSPQKNQETEEGEARTWRKI